MTDERYQLTRRKALAGLATVGAAGAAAGLGTSALYSDEETFENNVITAGTTNLIVEAAVVSVDTSNEADDPSENGLYVNIEDNTADGDPATGLTVSDMKPGDSFILRYTVNVQDNPMYVAATATNADDEEGENPEPEPSPGADEGGDGIGDGNGDDAGDLDNNIEVTFGYDSDRTSLHDNSLEGGITADPNGNFSTATSFISVFQTGFLYRGRNGADPGIGQPGGHGDGTSSPTRIGGDDSASNVDREKVTHFVEYSLPDSVGNEIQGDSFRFDIVWNAEQVRNNPDPTSASEVDGNANTATSTSTSTPT